MIKRFSSQTLAKFASLYAGLAYGLYWIPLRGLEQAGLHDVLPALMFNLVQMILILPLIVWRWPGIRCRLSPSFQSWLQSRWRAGWKRIDPGAESGRSWPGA